MLKNDAQSRRATPRRDLKLFVRRITDAKRFLYSHGVPLDVKEYFLTKISCLKVNTIIFTDSEASVTLKLVTPEAGKVAVSLRVFEEILACTKEDPYSTEVFLKRIPKLIKNAIVSGDIFLGSSDITIDDITNSFYTLMDLLHFHRFYQSITEWWMLESYKTYTPNNIDQMEGSTEFRRKREMHLFNANITGKIVLDAGSGFGRLIPVLLKKNVAEVIAIDISRNLSNRMTGYLHKSGHSLRKVCRICADIRYLPLRPELCDYIYCIGVISQIPYDGKALEELSRVLKKRGIAYIEFREKPIPTMPQFYMWERRCDRQAIERLFVKAQLQLLKTYRARISKNSIVNSFLCVGRK